MDGMKKNKTAEADSNRSAEAGGEVSGEEKVGRGE